MEEVRLRNTAGRFFFDAQTITPATIAKLMITASQYAPSRLKPVILERKRTDAECLNCSVSSALDSAGLGLSFAAAPCSVRAPSSEEACAFTPGRKLKHIASVRRTNHKPNRGFFIVHLPGPGIRRVRAPCE